MNNTKTEAEANIKKLTTETPRHKARNKIPLWPARRSFSEEGRGGFGFSRACLLVL